MTEEAIKSDLLNKFQFLTDTLLIQRKRRMLADVSIDNFRKVFDYAVKNLHFEVLCTITGMDEGNRFAFIYHIATLDGIILNLKTSVPKEAAKIRTISDSFPAADIYEREIADLLGVTIEGLPQGKRYPLPDDWPAGEYPLRKDWKQSN